MDDMNGIYARFKYIPKRCRKSVSVGFAGETLEEILQRAKQYLNENDGRYESGYYTKCKLWTHTMLDGRQVRMQIVPMMHQGISIDLTTFWGVSK